MGQDKAMLKHSSGVSFLEHAAARADQVCDQVVLSGNRPYRSNYPTMEDSLCSRGPIAGIVTALEAAHRGCFAACLVTPVDMPLLSPQQLIAIKERWLNDPDRLVCGVSQQQHRVQPLVAIYPNHLRIELRAVAQSEDRSLRRWIESIDHDEVMISQQACHNINTPEDRF